MTYSRWIDFLTVLLIGGISTNESKVASPNFVYDSNNITVGRRIELASTFLVTGELLNYTCRENTPIEDNVLININSPNIRFPENRVERVTCFSSANQCSVNRGSLPWQRNLSGEYACKAYPEESYYIHWIGQTQVSPSHVWLRKQDYGMSLTLYCAMEVEPANMSYTDKYTASWYCDDGKGDRNPMISGRNDVVIISMNRGINSSMHITRYNAIQHGCSYICSITFHSMLDRSFLSQPTAVAVSSELKIELVNNKKENFLFGPDEEVDISCYAQSYPFPTNITMEVLVIERTTWITPSTNGITHYELDVTSRDIDKHNLTIRMTRAADIFHKKSKLRCKVSQMDKIYNETVVIQIANQRTIGLPNSSFSSTKITVTQKSLKKQTLQTTEKPVTVTMSWTEEFTEETIVIITLLSVMMLTMLGGTFVILRLKVGPIVKKNSAKVSKQSSGSSVLSNAVFVGSSLNFPEIGRLKPISLRSKSRSTKDSNKSENSSTIPRKTVEYAKINKTKPTAGLRGTSTSNENLYMQVTKKLKAETKELKKTKYTASLRGTSTSNDHLYTQITEELKVETKQLPDLYKGANRLKTKQMPVYAQIKKENLPNKVKSQKSDRT